MERAASGSGAEAPAEPVAEKRRPEVCRWRGDHIARRAVYDNRARLLAGVAEVGFGRRAELVERSFAPVLDRGGMRRARLRDSTNVHKRYLLHVAGYNLGLIMRLLTGHGTAPEAATTLHAAVGIAFPTDDALIVVVSALVDDASQARILIAVVGPHG